MTRPTRPNHLIVVGALSDASGTPRDAKRSIDDRYSVPVMLGLTVVSASRLPSTALGPFCVGRLRPGSGLWRARYELLDRPTPTLKRVSPENCGRVHRERTTATRDATATTAPMWMIKMIAALWEFRSREPRLCCHAEHFPTSRHCSVQPRQIAGEHTGGSSA